jgi:hypothetical protein
MVREALPVVKEWAQKLLYSAHGPNSLTSVMIATALIFNFDRENAKNYVYRAPCAKSPVVGLLITSFEGVVSHSITHGINFLRYDFLTHLYDSL